MYHHLSSLMVIGLLLAAFAKADFICPTDTYLSMESSVSSCHCFNNEGADDESLINFSCHSVDLNDFDAGFILDSFGIDQLKHLSLKNNRLTRVPDQVKLFNRLNRVILSHNGIQTLPFGAFNFTETPLEYLSLANNLLDRIEPGAFQGEFENGSSIRLSYNSLTRFESAVFEPLLEKMVLKNASVDIWSNPIDCKEDICHLAWLIRDSRHLLRTVRGGQCANGTHFRELDSNGFQHCFLEPTKSSSFFVSPELSSSCPSPESYAPCGCLDGTDGKAFLFCYGRTLNDARMNHILDSFIIPSPTGVTTNLGAINILGNRLLTRIPEHFKIFDRLKWINLDKNNISSIKPGTFDNLSGDNGIGPWIVLNGNSLTRFESGVFQSVLANMAHYGYPYAFVSLTKNPIDCESDPCHLAWLIRSNRHLLKAVHDGQCLNGTRFDELNPNAYDDCPKSTVSPRMRNIRSRHPTDMLSNTQNSVEKVLTRADLLANLAQLMLPEQISCIIQCFMSQSIKLIEDDSRICHRLCLPAHNTSLAVQGVVASLEALLPSPLNCDNDRTASVVCPNPSDYSPCECNDRGDETVILNCRGRQLNDSKISDILDAFISTPGVSPLASLNLWQNKLTRVPEQVKLFNRLEHLDLEGNQIRVVESGAFKSNQLLSVFLSDNQLIYIEPGAFKACNCSIFLMRNQLTRFDSEVFLQVLSSIASDSSELQAYFHITDNPIDCESDPCHMAWIIRDNRRLLSVVNEGQCSNGTLFNQLDSNEYKDCPTRDRKTGETMDLALTQEDSLEPFVCPESTGDFVYPFSCLSYYICSNGTPYLFECPKIGSGVDYQLVFNPVTSRCDDPSNVPSCVML